MRTLVMWCLAALAAGLLIPMTGCTEGSGMTDVLTIMSESPNLAQSKVDTPWVWLMLADGSDFLPLFDSGAPEGGIAQGMLSPSGESIVYIRRAEDYEICRYDLSTGLVTPLYTADDFQPTPAWSPDGQTIMFTTGTQLYTMDAEDGSSVAPLLDLGPSDQLNNPSYNLAGTKILCLNHNDIVVANANGSEPETVYTSAYVLHPQWMSDGRIIFANDPDDDDTFDIYIVNLDGTGLINLTETPGVDERHPTCNAAGNLIAWSVQTPRGATGEVFVAAFNGAALVGDPVNVTSNAPVPCWAPTFGRIPTAKIDSIFNAIL